MLTFHRFHPTVQSFLMETLKCSISPIYLWTRSLLLFVFQALFIGNDPWWILGLVEWKQPHPWTTFSLQKQCSPLSKYLFQLCLLLYTYLKFFVFVFFFNSIPIGTGLEEPQIKLSAWILLTHTSNFTISVSLSHEFNLIRWKTCQQVQGFFGFLGLIVCEAFFS